MCSKKYSGFCVFQGNVMAYCQLTPSKCLTLSQSPVFFSFTHISLVSCALNFDALGDCGVVGGLDQNKHWKWLRQAGCKPAFTNRGPQSSSNTHHTRYWKTHTAGNWWGGMNERSFVLGVRPKVTKMYYCRILVLVHHWKLWVYSLIECLSVVVGYNWSEYFGALQL